MKLLKARTTDETTEFFNLDKVLTITPNQNGDKVKILMGAGLFWWCWADSLQIIAVSDNDFPDVLREARP